MDYPTSLNTSDWVDALAGLSREDQIAVLATFHRRVASAAASEALSALIDPDPDADDPVTRAAQAALDQLVPARDYDPKA